MVLTVESRGAVDAALIRFFALNGLFRLAIPEKPDEIKLQFVTK